MRKILFLVLSFFFVTVACFAQEPKILNYDKDAKTIKLEIEGKEHVFSVPSEEIAPAEIPAEVTLEEAQPEETPKQERKKFAKGPAPANVGARLWNIPTDNLLQNLIFLRNQPNGVRVHRLDLPFQAASRTTISRTLWIFMSSQFLQR